jgi:hypothetical protein
MAATEGGLTTTLRSSGAAGRTELVGPGTTLADERLLPVLPPLRPLLPTHGLRRGSTVAVARSAALALALVAGASAAGSWVAAVGLPDLGIVAAAETGIVLERLALVPAPGARTWPAVVAALLDAIDVVLVRAPAGLPAAQARRLAARARERGAVLVPLGAWSESADLRLTVTSSAWQGLGQGHGRLQARRVEVVATGRGAATRERRVLLWLPSTSGAIASAAPPRAVDNPETSTPRLATLPLWGPRQPRAGLPRAPAAAPAGNADARVGPGGPAGLALAGEGDAPAGEGRTPGAGGSPGMGRPSGVGGSPEAPLADAG